MKKINYKLNEQNQIVEWQEIPFNESLPYIEVKDPNEIILFCSTIVENKLYINRDVYTKQLEQSRIRLQKQLRINELNQFLCSTDYLIIKDYEGLMTSDKDIEQLQQAKADRAAARAEINQLQEELKKDS